MTQEERKELIIALCGYLPYKCKGKYEIVRRLESETKIERFDDELDSNVLDYDFEHENFIPYLRSLKNMTEEEAMKIFGLVLGDREILSVSVKQDGIEADVDDGVSSSEKTWIFYEDIVSSIEILDYLNERHLDYRMLIQRGLAEEAPEWMYNSTTEQ